METILHLLPLPADGQDAFRAAAPEARHIFLPTDDRGGLRDLAPELFQQTTILFGFVPPDRLRRFSHLKWVQSWNAGVDSYLAPGVLPEGAMLTSAAGPTVPLYPSICWPCCWPSISVFPPTRTSRAPISGPTGARIHASRPRRS